MEYEKLLNKVYEKLPKKVEEKKRFEVPVAICERQGSKTVIKNFSDILSTLRRDAAHFSKYLFKELAAPGNVQGNTLVLQRKLYSEMLKKKIEDYVKEFVYCKECREPDTKLKKEGRVFILRCDACGAKYPVRTI
jgi:translation initiation factor 2 subunit 2